MTSETSEEARTQPERRVSGVSSISQTNFDDTSRSVSLSFLQPNGSARIEKLPSATEDVSKSKRRSDFYGEVFAYREASSSIRETVLNGSVIAVVVNTNVIIDNEEVFLHTFAEFLAERYHRDSSTILINLQHSASISLGGGSQSMYHVTISAVPVLVQSTVNKRNAALLQQFLADFLGIPAQRGIIHFQAVSEANLATNGNTLLGDIERQEPSSVLHRHKTSDPAWEKGRGRNRYSKRWTIFKEAWSPIIAEDEPIVAITASRGEESCAARGVSLNTDIPYGELDEDEVRSRPSRKEIVRKWFAQRRRVMQRLGRAQEHMSLRSRSR